MMKVSYSPLNALFSPANHPKKKLIQMTEILTLFKRFFLLGSLYTRQEAKNCFKFINHRLVKLIFL